MKQRLNRLNQIMMKKTNRFLFASLAVVLALAIGFLAHFQMFGMLVRAEEASKEYVGELRTYQAKTVEEAKTLCKNDGFIPVEGNLNDGTGEDAVVIGYTTTTDKEAAITDIRMMQMTSGFSTVNYKELIEKQYPGLDSMIDEEFTTIREFRDKYNGGSYNAQTALKYLNLFEIPDVDMKLGDYFLSDKLSKDMLEKLFLQTSAVVSTTSYNLLALGVSDGSEDNWANRVYQNKDICDVGSDDDSVDAGTDPFAELDRKYLSSAERLVSVIQDFSTKYQNGRAREDANGGELPELDSETASPEEMNAHAAEPTCIVAHEVLNKFKYDDDMPLGDWFVEMGNKTLSNKAELRELYPLIASMSFGQIITAQLVGFNICTLYLDDLSSIDDKFNDAVNEAKGLCRDYDNTDAISVWSGVDQKLFETECAVTGDAQRYTNLKNTAENLVKRNKAIETLEAISSICTMLTSLAGGAIVLLELPTMVVSLLSYFELMSIGWCINHGTMFFIFALLGKVAYYVGLVSKILLVVVLIIMVIVFLYELLKPECDDLEYTSIPTMAMDLSTDYDDSDNRGLLRYDLIHSPDGKADLNAYEGKQWNALYSSQNLDAGVPIEVVDGKAPFIIQKNNAENPAGYKAVKNFDELYAANLNANVRESKAPAVYLFYSAPNEKAGTTVTEEENDQSQDGGTNSGEQQTATEPAQTQPAPAEKKQYIASVYLSCEDSESLAKNKLTQQGYKVIDVNLTPSLRFPNKLGNLTIKSYSYLGYTVTTNEKAAVTDIRIAKLKSTSQAVVYGTVTYTAAGYDGHGNSICYTKDASVGSPILADDIQVADKLSDGKKGYEAVCYFGGTAYNFDNSEYPKDWDMAKYIFFSPSEKFTSGTEYISGLFFVSGANANEAGWSIKEYAEKLGGKLLGSEDFTKGRTWLKYFANYGTSTRFYVEKLQTYLCYTTTYNPKRAIYDVQFYAGTPRMQNFATTLNAYTGNSDSNYATTGYGITSVFMQSCKHMNDQSETRDKELLFHYELNNYDDFTVSAGESNDCETKEVDNIIPGVKWKTVISQPRMLYACGVKNGYDPLTKDDLVLSGSSEAPEGFASVQDVKFPYETKPLNLAYYYYKKSNECSPAYLYIRRAAPVRGKYIASVKVATYNPDQSWSEEERAAYNNFSNDSCYIALLGSSTEIINQSLALYPKDAWYNVTDQSGEAGTVDYNTRAAYLGVTYTNNPAKAIHGLLRYRAQDGKTPPETLTVNGAKYSLVQNVSSKNPVPITSQNMREYYLYATTSSGGSSTGDALTEIQISNKIFEPGLSTVLTVDHGDKAAEKDFYGNTVSQAEYVIPFGDTNDTLYIHQKTNTNLTGIDSFFVGVGDSEADAKKDLLTQGATNCLPLNLNKGAGASAHVYIGYHYYNPDYVNTKKTKYYMESAVKDLYIYVGSDPQKRLTIDKRKYTLCGNRNLNYGTDGEPMYLYQTTALINNKDKNDASYITSIAAAQFDRVPEDIAENRWENLLTTENKRININQGVRSFDLNDLKQHTIDSRIFVYVHRNDNYVKPEAVITGGYFTDTTVFGDLVLSKK